MSTSRPVRCPGQWALHLKPCLGDTFPGDGDLRPLIELQAHAPVDHPPQQPQKVASAVDGSVCREADPPAGEPEVVTLSEQQPVETRGGNLQGVTVWDRVLDVQLGRQLSADPGTVVQGD